MAGPAQHRGQRSPSSFRRIAFSQTGRAPRKGHRRGGRVWKPNVIALLSSLVALGGLIVLLYPEAANWFSQYNQSQIISSGLPASGPAPTHEFDEDLEKAHQYNKALNVGAVLEANVNVPVGQGTHHDDSLHYEDLLRLTETGVMGRVQIPSIDVDLPVYHGTADAALLLGAGHLEGTSLPVGGADTRTVITAHRGLANARMFTDLDEVGIGDTFSISAGGQTLTYQVREKKVVEPDETESLRTERGRDLATLVTCTPLGINSHRILLTGERVVPTPVEDVRRAEQPSQLPHFPWWAVWLGIGVVVIVSYALWSSRVYEADALAEESEVEDPKTEGFTVISEETVAQT